MSAESIVVSLEWAKKLKEAGWQLNWSWMFREGYTLGDDGEPQSWLLTHGHKPDLKDKYVLPCPTAEEILQRLPMKVPLLSKPPHDAAYLKIHRMASGFGIGYRCRRDCLDYPCDEHTYFHEDPHLANAAAAMYCYLAEQKLLPAT